MTVPERSASIDHSRAPVVASDGKVKQKGVEIHEPLFGTRRLRLTSSITSMSMAHTARTMALPGAASKRWIFGRHSVGAVAGSLA